MRHQRLITVLLLVYVWGSHAVQGAVLQDLQKVGEAKLEVWFWDVYHSSLYTDSGEYAPGRYPVALKIDYLRDISAGDLVEATAEQWQKLGYSQQQIAPWLEQVNQLWPDISKGDQLIFRVNPQQTGTFYYNQQALGNIDSPEFCAAFLNIWLSPDTEYPKLREKLIKRSDK
ncbi:chalcone isomerase family protein [Lacimicrobium sp. SS2-24]|uniref:chalcone isomerase family protein n=1 Tax=Lacimicrobium sp. SS2-24 TaxID=2005569 RepID=UPI000B4C1A29|nr:chalcone isomerase family protein [Lacimicrobium sp. SS2-24]